MKALKALLLTLLIAFAAAANAETFNIMTFGAKCDGVTNDAAAIQKVHDLIVARGKTGVLTAPPGVTCKVSTALTWDASMVHASLYGVRFDFSGLAAGTAISISKGGAQAAIAGLIMQGNGSAGVVTGIKIAGTSNPTAARDMVLRDVTALSFGTCLQVGDYAYILTFDHIRCLDSTTVFSYTGVTQAGERIVFSNSLLQGDVAGGRLIKVAATATALDLFLVNTSLDSSTTGTVSVEILNGGNQVYCVNCHIEASDFTVAPIQLTGAGASFVMVGGRINSNQVTVTAANFVSMSGLNNNGTDGATFDHVFFNMGNTSSGNFATGANAGIRIHNPLGNFLFSLYSGGGVAYTGAESRGTCTVAVAGSTTAGTQTYTDRACEWYRRGNMVTVSLRANMSAKDVATAGNIQITGLPFTSKNVLTQPVFAVSAYQNINLTGYIQLSGVVDQNATTISLLKGALNGALAPVAAADISATTLISGTAVYEVQ